MHRLILAALLCLPLALSAQKSKEDFPKHEIGLNIHTQYGLNGAELTYKLFLSPKNAVRFTVGFDNSFINSYSTSIGLRHTLYKNDKFELSTGFDLNYRQLKYGKFTGERGDQKTARLDIPLELSYNLGKNFYITTSLSLGLDLYDNYNGGILNKISNPPMKLNLGISKRF